MNSLILIFLHWHAGSSFDKKTKKQSLIPAFIFSKCTHTQKPTEFSIFYPPPPTPHEKTPLIPTFILLLDTL